ncbi:hypothetical protein [Maritimibacter sp. UBA3975]|uniref:hypothetical protein n=1 Tax=Maritimibacter sp. UBA3975 TaxID=1946833 RepID=UPI0025B8EFF9|nr:hypothetical protein [Maritimibacter sp. UBA3975]
MTHTREARRTDAPTEDSTPNDRGEVIAMLAEAGLGQGHGIEWLLDRLTTGEEAAR